MSSLGRIGIGTAQFGMEYGISNTTGRTPDDEIASILEDARREGVRYIDTASLYGDAEETLGRILPPESVFRIVTKLGHFTSGSERSIERTAMDLFDASLGKMRRESIYALLAHCADDLLAPQGERLWAVLQQLKQEGKVHKIGVSVYSPEEAERLSERYPLDLVQLPLNLLDQRMLKSGLLHEMHARGVEIHSRSCFLQGLLLMKPETLGAFFDPVKERLVELRGACCERGITLLEAALSFVLSVGDVDCIIIGVNSSAQFGEIRTVVLQYDQGEQIDFSRFAVDAPEIVEPRNWPRRGGEKSGSRT